MKMQLDIIYNHNEVIVKNMEDFEPQHIFECGQSFRWNREIDGSYTGIAYKKILNVKKIDRDIIFKNTNKKEFNEIWMEYFDLNTDYKIIKKEISKDDPIMKKAIDFGNGIRILKQEPWETIASFIISANNNIPRIKKTVEILSENYGDYLGQYNDIDRYAFPDVKTIAGLTPEELKSSGIGYRASYIIKTAQMIVDEPIDLCKLQKLDIKKCEKSLLQYHGVGPKVAHCILFFCIGQMEAFPVDTWVKRVMEYFYFKEETKPKVIQEFATKKYGKYAGYAQQYLFYYARELNIGKK